ncbi:hypothetical protein PFTANZ_03542 [Plasmodium falciparum Tanzania (2000708)]|uniref:Uncharacterized protein n=1 Tax=Plasmodium falciparum Tanzania (2000708) TaxID=1036725 RepID=A0A024W4X7_PLAFA|nr:hypothetical protein PFTANZ_03542 [Plasmodium falciparum Tanzania (2000708)]
MNRIYNSQINILFDLTKLKHIPSNFCDNNIIMCLFNIHNNTKIKEKISQKQCFFFFLFPFFVNNNENKNSDRCINKMIIILRDNFTSKL